MNDNKEITKTFPAAGFQVNPQNINRNGAPKKEESISGLVRELLHNKPQGSEKSYRELFAMRVMKLALEGDMTAIREIWDRMEGGVKGIANQLNVQINQYTGTPEQQALVKEQELIDCNEMLKTGEMIYESDNNQVRYK
jgi:hypothetical protein